MASRRILSSARELIARHRLLGSGDRVAIGLSGGSDSVALARALIDLARGAPWTIAGVVHVHHGLRGAEADDDETFCRALAGGWGLPIVVEHVDVGAGVAASGRSLEVVARELRYAAFERAVSAMHATRVATGHTQDDQAETVLLRLLRGAGARGLGGIRVRRGPYVRPLLGCRRAELRQYLAELGQPYREDLSNDDRSITRNRLRHEVLPVLERFSPGAVPALARCAALAADDEVFLQAAAIKAASGIVLSGEAPPGSVRLEAPALAALPLAVARRVVRHLADTLAGDIRWSAGHIDQVVDLARDGRGPGQVDLPGLVAGRRGPVLTLRRALAAPEVPAVFERALAVPGRVEVPEAGIAIEATIEPPAGGAPRDGTSPGMGTGRTARLVRVGLAGVALPLVVRSRRPGDRMRPLGAPGRRKLQDVFVDRKVPREDRDRVPLVVDAGGRIVWAVGVALAEGCRVTAPEAGVVTLKSIPLVGER
ncbi:MAG: tRNA lysidine(34) synthetase TilS [Vicinamibacterales bacterium]